MQSTTTITYERPWFRNGKLYAGAVIIIILAQILAGALQLSSAMSYILATQIVLFMLLFRRPVWAMAALLIGQFTASGFMLPLSSGTLISVRFIWTVLAIIILIPVLKAKGGIKTGGHARSIMVPAAIFFILASVANLSNVDTAFTFQYLRTGLTALAIVFFLPAVVNNEKDLKLLAIVILIVCSISSLAAVMQHYQHLGLPVFTLWGDTEIHRGRTPGLAEGPVHLAFELPTVILPLAALFLQRAVHRGRKVILPILAVLMLVALYFTYTRSGIYSLVPGALVMVFLLKGAMRKELLITFLALVVVFLGYINLTSNRYSQGFAEESSAAGRLVLWQAGVMIALDHPIFGIGGGRFVEISELYSSEVETSEVVGVGEVLGKEEAHNDFIRVWVSYGTPALLAYLWVFFNLFRNFYRGYRRSTEPFLKALAIGGFAALMAYIVNAFTHNLMDSVPLLWILAGFSIAILKLAKAPEPAAVTEVAAKTITTKQLPDSASPAP